MQENVGIGAAAAARAFLAGADRTPLDTLARDMEVAAAAQAFERAAALRDRLEPLAWLDAQLAALREARAHGSFVYPAAGFDGSTIWYVINGGRTVAALHPPTDAKRAAAARERLRSVYPAGTGKDSGEVIEALPQGPLRDRLMSGEGKFVQKELQRGILSDALARGEIVAGTSLVKGSHVRLR